MNPPDPTATTSSATTPQAIPVEIVSEEEMALIEAALSSARAILSSSSSSSSLPLLARRQSPPRVVSLSIPARRLSSSPSDSPEALPDIEDAGLVERPKSFLERFRRREILSVTDITSVEWCEKQVEFALLHGKPERSEAMKAGSARHKELEEEVMIRVEVSVKSAEDYWALKFLNFIVGVNQLLFEGMTRELPVIGVLEGLWVLGVVDEIRLPMTGPVTNPLLIDTKTRRTERLPSQAQIRNSRLQLMCYKHLWDSTIACSFSADQFFSHTKLNSKCILSEAVRGYGATLGFQPETMEDVFMYYRKMAGLLLPSQELLLLRYELQSDRSLLKEYSFEFDSVWFSNTIKNAYKFWLSHREASFVPGDEQWKCNFCSFAAKCPRALESSSPELYRINESQQ